MDTNSSIPSEGWLASVPIELHGHRKKLDFFIHSIELLCKSNGLKPNNIRVLEVGCSNGRNVGLPLAEKGYQVTGVDLHSPSISWARSHNTFRNARFLCQDFTLFFDDKKFDVVILSDILEHVENPSEIVRNALGCLNHGGMVMVCIPNGNGPYENEQRFLRATCLDHFIAFAKQGLKKILGKPLEKQVEYNFDLGHIQFFSMADFQKLVSDSGLKIDIQANGALFGGNATYFLGLLFPFIVKPSLWLANHLPPKMVTTWYFRLSRLD